MANKVPGIRAAVCYDEASARNSREHNGANVLTLGGKTISNDKMREIVHVWLSTDAVAVQRVQEGPRIFSIVSPRVLAIEYHGKHSVFIAREAKGKFVFDLLQEVNCGFLVIGVARVVKSDGIGELCAPDASRTVPCSADTERSG